MKAGQLLSLITLFFLLAPYFSFAQPIKGEPESPTINLPTQILGCTGNETLFQCIMAILSGVFRILLFLALLFAAIFIVWAGIVYITGWGATKDKDAKQIAKDRIIYAALGLVVALLSWALLRIISIWVTQTPKAQ